MIMIVSKVYIAPLTDKEGSQSALQCTKNTNKIIIIHIKYNKTAAQIPLKCNKRQTILLIKSLSKNVLQ